MKTLVFILMGIMVCIDCKTLWKDANLQLKEISKKDRSFGESNMATVKNPAGGRQKVLRVFYPKGSYRPGAKPRGGAQFFKRLSPQRRIVTLTYDLYFDKKFNFVKGGKLPGLYGGSKDCSGGRSTDKCFSTRFMWRKNGAGEVYLYAPKNQDKNFCKRKEVICNFDYGHSLGRGKLRFQRGKWMKISQRVRLNDVGKKNGYIKVWLNKKLILNAKNLNLRNSKKVNIDGMFFSTFFGGSKKSWATPSNVYTYYRNFKMTT